MNGDQTAAYLREKARQCFSIARYHEGEAAADLNPVGRELLARRKNRKQRTRETL